jgi:hypothetical protein
MEILNLNQVRKEEVISFLKEIFPGNYYSNHLNRDKTYKLPKTQNSSGHEEITNKIVKTCTTQISHPLCYICNQSLYTFTERFRYFITDKT